MSIPISLAGYPGSALFTLLLFRLHAARRERTGLFLIAALATVGLTLFVRNEYGILWCIGFALITILIGLAAANWLRVGYYMLIAYLSLVESVISACSLVFLSFNDPAAAGDATNLAQATWIPAPVWAIAFALFALWCASDHWRCRDVMRLSVFPRHSTSISHPTPNPPSSFSFACLHYSSCCKNT